VLDKNIKSWYRIPLVKSIPDTNGTVVYITTMQFVILHSMTII